VEDKRTKKLVFRRTATGLKWKTKENVMIKVTSMSDQHLLNTIAFIGRSSRHDLMGIYNALLNEKEARGL
jgi:hypothetical protein